MNIKYLYEHDAADICRILAEHYNVPESDISIPAEIRDKLHITVASNTAPDIVLAKVGTGMSFRQKAISDIDQVSRISPVKPVDNNSLFGKEITFAKTGEGMSFLQKAECIQKSRQAAEHLDPTNVKTENTEKISDTDKTETAETSPDITAASAATPATMNDDEYERIYATITDDEILEWAKAGKPLNQLCKKYGLSEHKYYYRLFNKVEKFRKEGACIPRRRRRGRPAAETNEQG